MSKYGYPHRKLREQWRLRVETGSVYCVHPRCGRPIVGEWDLAHDPMDPTRYLGPMCASCNRDTSLERRLRGRVRGGFRWVNPSW